MGPIGRLQSLLLGFLLISLTTADCPSPPVNNVDVDENTDPVSTCPGYPDMFPTGCRLTLVCNQGFIPNSPNYPDMRSVLTCGLDSKWRDSSGNENLLSCVTGCYYPIPSDAHYEVEVPPSAVYNFTDPHTNKLSSYLYPGDKYSIHCVGDRIALYVTIPENKAHDEKTTFTCRSDGKYDSPETNIYTPIEKNCWYYCQMNFEHEITNPARGGYDIVNNYPEYTGAESYKNWRIRDNTTANTMCIMEYTYPPDTVAGQRGFQSLKCDAVNNILYDVLTGAVTTQQLCIEKSQPGECNKLDAALQNLTVVVNNCTETSTGVVAHCVVKVKCKNQTHPVDPKYYTADGLQSLTCLDNVGWVNDTGSYVPLMQCTDGCIREVDYSLTNGIPHFFSPDSEELSKGSQCLNLTFYIQPPPENAYYCEDLNPTALCNNSCRLLLPYPTGVQLFNQSNEGTLQDVGGLYNYMQANHLLIYNCMEGYAYPPGSTPTQFGNMQRIYCTPGLLQLTDMDLNTKLESLTACVPVSGCPKLYLNLDVVYNGTNCTLDKNSYNTGCEMKYDCASGFYPVEMEYFLNSGQDLTCTSSGQWYSKALQRNVNETLSCKHGCYLFNLTEAFTSLNTSLVNITLIYINSTDGDTFTCYDMLTLDTMLRALQDTLRNRSKYYCNFVQNNASIIDVKFVYACDGSCLMLNTSVLPPGLKVVKPPGTFELNDHFYVGGGKEYVFQCENGTNVFGKPPDFQQRLRCGGTTYIDPVTNQPYPSFFTDHLLPCSKTPTCQVTQNNTSVIISSGCLITDGTVSYGCNVTVGCKNGFYPIEITNVGVHEKSYRCNITTGNNATFINVNIGQPEPLMECGPGTCPVPSENPSVVRTSNCTIGSDLTVTTNCIVTEQCKDGLVPVNINGTSNSTRVSRCSTSNNKNGTLINVLITAPLPPLNCSEPTGGCDARQLSNTSIVINYSCQLTDGVAVVGCTVNMTCKNGLYPVDITAVNQYTRSLKCEKSADGNSTWVNINIGSPNDSFVCAPLCNTTTNPGTKLNHSCPAVQGGVTVGCNATLVCEGDLIPISVDTNETSVPMQCQAKQENSTWINLLTSEPAGNFTCGCKAPTFDNGTNITSNCYVKGVGGPPDCTIVVQCPPGSARIYGKSNVNRTATIKCEKLMGQQKATWVQIEIGTAFVGLNCTNTCPNVTIPNAHIITSCAFDDGYQDGCPAQFVCDDGYVGSTLYKFSRVVDVTCKAVNSNDATSTFVTIEGKKIEPFCIPPGNCPPVTPLVVVNSSSTCYQPGSGGPPGCSIGAKCPDGTAPIYGNGTFNSTQKMNCTLPAGQDNATWIRISIGEGSFALNCTKTCPSITIPNAHFNTSCDYSGGYQQGCPAVVVCNPGFNGTHKNQFRKAVNVTCDNGTFIEIDSGKPVEDFCVQPPACPPLNHTIAGNSTDNCYIPAVGGPPDCTLNATCIQGYAAIYGQGKVNTTTTLRCDKADGQKNATWVQVTIGGETTGWECSPTCANVSVPNAHMETDCPSTENGTYQLECPAKFVCDDGYVGSNPKYNNSNTVDVKCSNKALDPNNAAFIENGTKKPPVEFCVPKTCPPLNSTNVKVDGACYLDGKPTSVNCTVNVSCQPGTAPMYTNSTVISNSTLQCDGTSSIQNAIWVNIRTKKEGVSEPCYPLCPPYPTVPNANATTICLEVSRGYQTGCMVTYICLPGYEGIEAKYQFRSVVNISCNSIDSKNSTFIEIVTGEPLITDICGPKTTTPEPLKCGVINSTSEIPGPSSCYLSGGAPKDCQVNVTCKPGTSPIYVNVTLILNRTTTVECEVDPVTNIYKWIDLTTGKELDPNRCHPPCPVSQIPHTTRTSTCVEQNGTYQVGCAVNVTCDEGYTGISVRYNTSSTVTVTCNSTEAKNSTFIENVTKKPVEGDLCELITTTPTTTTSSEPRQICVLWTRETQISVEAQDCALDPMNPGNFTAGSNIVGISVFIDCSVEIHCKDPSYVSSTYGCQKNSITVICNKTADNAGDFWEVESRLAPMNLSCVPAATCTTPASTTPGITTTFIPGNATTPQTTPGGPTPPGETGGCDEIPIDNSTEVFNTTCMPFPGTKISPKNCTQEIRCLKGWHPALSVNLKYGWHSVECYYNPNNNTYYWYDLTLKEVWQQFKCLNGCINATETHKDSSVVVETKNEYSMVCNLTTVAYKTGKYYCNTDGDTVKNLTSCNGTCPPLIVNSPLSIGKGPEPLTYKGLVLINGTYVINCPEGTVYSDSGNSTRTYTCNGNEAYTYGNEKNTLVAVNDCQVSPPETTPNCTLTVTEGVEIIPGQNCQANRTGNVYQISCEVTLKCKEGYYPANKNVTTQTQFCKGNEVTNVLSWWTYVPSEIAPPFTCIKGCIPSLTEHIKKRKETTTTKENVSVICDVEYIVTKLIDKLCKNVSVKPDGEIDRNCTNTCLPLELDGGLTYIALSPIFYYNLVIIGGRYKVQCPHDKIWPETNTSWKEFTCSGGGKYNTTWETGLTIAENRCVNPPPRQGSSEGSATAAAGDDDLNPTPELKTATRLTVEDQLISGILTVQPPAPVVDVTALPKPSG